MKHQLTVIFSIKKPSFNHHLAITLTIGAPSFNHQFNHQPSIHNELSRYQPVFPIITHQVTSLLGGQGTHPGCPPMTEPSPAFWSTAACLMARMLRSSWWHMVAPAIARGWVSKRGKLQNGLTRRILSGFMLVDGYWTNSTGFWVGSCWLMIAEFGFLIGWSLLIEDGDR